MDDEAAEGPPEIPQTPYTPEDGLYQAIVSQYLGLRRHGADPLGAGVIAAANLHLTVMANAAAQQQPGELPGSSQAKGG